MNPQTKIEKNKLSVIVTSFKEPNTIANCISQLIKSLSKLTQPSEILFVCPDKETSAIAIATAKRLNYIKFFHIQDPQKGKPYALNIAFKKATGELLILTDGDVYIDENAIPEIINAFITEDIGAITGRPVCINNKNSFLGYSGHMFMDAAHQKRSSIKNDFYILSGYLFAMRPFDIEIPLSMLDDVYISYKINELGYKIGYCPNAKVFVKQPETIKGWIKQKTRSIAGTFNIKTVFPNSQNLRNMTSDIEFAFFPILYAKNLKQFFWSLLNYPLRFYIWINAFWKNKVQNKKATDLWYDKSYKKEVNE